MRRMLRHPGVCTRDRPGIIVQMSHANDHGSSPGDAWIFGLEEIPAVGKGQDGTVQPVAPALGKTVIRVPEGTPEVLWWAAEEIVAQCGQDWKVASVLLQWLRIEAGEAQQVGVESCRLERVSDDQIRLHANYRQWEDLAVPLSDVRRMLIDMMQFLLAEAHRPLPAWRIRRLGERDWKLNRNAE